MLREFSYKHLLPEKYWKRYKAYIKEMNKLGITNEYQFF